jgi:hypothetical protein
MLLCVINIKYHFMKISPCSLLVSAFVIATMWAASTPALWSGNSLYKSGTNANDCSAG